MSPHAHPRASPKRQLRGPHTPHPFFIDAVALILFLQPALGTKLVRVVAPERLVAADDVRVEAYGTAGWDEGAVGESETAGRDVALEGHGDGGVEADGFADYGFEV